MSVSSLSDSMDQKTADYLDLLKGAVEKVNKAKDRLSALKEITDAMVPHISDWCAVSILEDGKLRQLSVTHTNPAKVKTARKLLDKYSSKLEPPSAYLQVLETGNASIVNRITDDMIRASMKNAEQLRLTRELELYSIMVFPVYSKGEVIGMLTLAWSEHKYEYSLRDMAFAEILAGLAARAIKTLPEKTSKT